MTNEDTLAVITRFESAFSPLDVDALMADMTDDCVFEHIAPEGAGFGRHEGQEAVRAVWEPMETHFPGFVLEVVELFAAGDRGTCRWEMRWNQPEGGDAFMRGVDVLTVRDGKVAEKLTYTA